MFDAFTERAIKVIILTQQESRRVHLNFVGVEHILLAILGEETGIGGKVLRAAGVSLRSARSEVEKITGRGTPYILIKIPFTKLSLVAGTPPAVEIPFTPSAKQVLSAAAREAELSGDEHIDTEHLLLGILDVPETLAIRVLKKLRLDPGRLRAALQREMKNGNVPKSPPQRKSSPLLDGECGLCKKNLDTEKSPQIVLYRSSKRSVDEDGKLISTAICDEGNFCSEACLSSYLLEKSKGSH
jgi:ATP-dependent Clp protease ATP-binding subunit ClpA